MGEIDHLHTIMVALLLMMAHFEMMDMDHAAPRRGHHIIGLSTKNGPPQDVDHPDNGDRDGGLPDRNCHGPPVPTRHELQGAQDPEDIKD